VNERFDGRGLVVKALDDSMEFCDLQHVVEPAAKIEQLDFSVEFPDAHEGADQMCQARAVDVIDIGEIEQKLSMSLGEKITNPFAECGAFFASDNAAPEAQNDDIAILSRICCQFMATSWGRSTICPCG